MDCKHCGEPLDDFALNAMHPECNLWCMFADQSGRDYDVCTCCGNHIKASIKRLAARILFTEFVQMADRGQNQLPSLKPTQSGVVRADDFLRLDAKGGLSVARTRRAFCAVARKRVQRKQLTHAVLDFRKVSAANVSPGELFEVVATVLEEAGFRKSDRVAILRPTGRGDRARFSSLCASNRGWHVEAFPNPEHAIEWMFRTDAEAYCEASR
jgi:hypothetical protein